MERVLITGAAGIVGTTLRPRLTKPGRVLRLVDIRPITDLTDSEEFVQGSFIDMGQMERACQGVDAVIDLARFEIGEEHAEESWELVTEVNIRGIHTVLEAARRQGVPRFVYASSNHAVGFHTRGDQPLDEYLTPAPDTPYGVGKVLGEALCSMYHNRYGLDVICVRIGSQFPEPTSVRMLATWLSPEDAGRLFEACITTPNPGYRIVWGMSANTRSWFSREEGRRIGYEPQDDAEEYAGALIERVGDLPPDAPELVHVGGTSAKVSVRRRARAR